MHFMILGAGGIGCYYGALLQRGGHRVTLVARGEHLRFMRDRGLEVRHPDFRFREPVDACSLDEAMNRSSADEIDLIMVAIKATQTEATLDQMQDWLKQDGCETPLLSLQNGVDNEPFIESKIGRSRTLGGLAIRIGGHVVEPGIVEATGPGQIVMGQWPSRHENQAATLALDDYAECFRSAGIPTTVADDIRLELWKKLLINNGVNPLSALTGLDTRALTSHPVFGDTVHRLMLEAAAVAQADGVPLENHDVDAMYQLICEFDAIKTSMLVDREKGRPLEIEAISGAIIRRAQRHAIATPITALVDALLEQNGN